MFFSVAYSDALLVMLVAGVLILLDRRQFAAASCLCAAATATRPTGVVLAAILLLWAIKDGYLRRKLGWVRLLLLGTVCVSGLVAFQLYLWHHFGRPDAFIAVQQRWGHRQTEVSNPILRVVTLKSIVQPAFRPIKAMFRGQIDHLLTPTQWNGLWNLLILIVAIVGISRRRAIPRLSFLLPILVLLEAFAADPVRGGRLVGIALSTGRAALFPAGRDVARAAAGAGSHRDWGFTRVSAGDAVPVHEPLCRLDSGELNAAMQRPDLRTHVSGLYQHEAQSSDYRENHLLALRAGISRFVHLGH